VPAITRAPRGSNVAPEVLSDRCRKGEQIMQPRVDINKHLGNGMVRAMFGFSNEVAANIDKKIFALIEIRASQINGCAYCIDMHTKDARAAGETEQRIYALSAWRETPFFTDRERAALEWAEAVTLVGESHVPDELYERVRAVFSEDELLALTLGVVVINAWNRLAVPFRAVPGTYKSRVAKTA
jgi:AhpD family alkylhydroperoxidase